MSFKEEYKSAMSSVSPDTEKIIAGVYEKLNEMEVPKKQNKTLVFAVVSSFAGAAACLALCTVVLLHVAPDFVKMDGAAMENANGIQTPNFAESNFSGGIADDKVPEGIESSICGELSQPEMKPEESDAESGGSIEFIGGDLATAKEVILDGVRYLSSGDTVKFSDKPENICVVKSSDGELFSVYLDDYHVYICKGEWQIPQMTYFYVETR